MRNDSYLRSRLEIIWQQHFSDLSRPNPITIKFGRKAKKRIGSIGARVCSNTGRHRETVIIINAHLKNSDIPEFVIDATIAHELCHYAHGFCSPLPQMCDFPHQGGVVERELNKRGLGEISKREWNWLQKHWLSYLAEAD